MKLERVPGDGWLALVGGGEATFGETEEADGVWMAKLPEDGAVGFLPTASGSADYGRHFAEYLEQSFGRDCETIPVYRPRDARRERNRARIEAAAGVYLGGGVATQLLETLSGTPCLEALAARITGGGMVAAIAAAAQAAGVVSRGLYGGAVLPGFGWLTGGVVETNFDPENDRRLRRLLAHDGVRWGLGIPAGHAVLLGPEGAIETVGTSYWLGDAKGGLESFGTPLAAPGDPLVDPAEPIH